MSDKKYLKLLDGHWYFFRRLPNTKKRHHKVSLKTKSLKVALQRRNKILAKWDEIIVDVHEAQAVMALREKYISTVNPEEKEHLRDLIQGDAEQLAVDLGVQHLLVGPEAIPEEHLPTEARKPINFYKIATNQLNPFKEIMGTWLKTIAHKGTRSDYRLAVEHLMEHVACAEEINHENAATFLKAAPKLYNVAKSTVQKWQSAYINLWKFLGKDYGVWLNHSIPATPEKEKSREAWENSEVRHLCETARGNNKKPWLYHAINIAAHTGARADAISKCEYLPAKQLVLFPKSKWEKRDRQIPMHLKIKDSLTYWMGNRREQNTISNAFTRLKKHQLGYPDSKVFHSFRNTFIQHLMFNNVPDHLISTAVGHKIDTMTRGRYGGGQAIVSTLKDAINLIDYSKPDWDRIYIN